MWNYKKGNSEEKREIEEREVILSPQAEVE